MEEASQSVKQPDELAPASRSTYGLAMLPAASARHGSPLGRSAERVVGFAVLLLSTGCAAGPAETVAAPTPTVEPERPPDIVAEGEVGGLNEEDVETAFQSLQPEIVRCVEQGMTRIEGLGGSCTVALRITREGGARWAYLKESTLGDRETERCILDAVRVRSWPKPLGGEGEAEHSFVIEGLVPTTKWDWNRVRPMRRALDRATWPCLGRTRGRFNATLYLRWDGHVLGAGVATSSAVAEEKSDCLADALRTLKLGKQRSRLTKVTFRVR